MLQKFDLKKNNSLEKKFLFSRFPFDGWVRMARQDKKTEELKARFGKKNSVIAYPNEKPKFEYRVIVSPQLSKSTEYTIHVNYSIKKVDANLLYKIEFSTDLPKYGKIILRVNGSFGRSEVFAFSRSTQTLSEDNDLLFGMNMKDVGEVKFL